MKSRRPAHLVRRATIRVKATPRRRAPRLWASPPDATKPDTHGQTTRLSTALGFESVVALDLGFAAARTRVQRPLGSTVS